MINKSYKILTSFTHETNGLGHPVGTSQKSWNGLPSWTSIVDTGFFFNVFSSAFKTVAELEVAVPKEL